MKLKNGLIYGAFFLSLGGVITKLIGAVYRIPLTNLLGAKGIGIYQMVFPLYTILLTFSSTGVPSGISKLIAEGNNPEKILKSSIKLFAIIGFITSTLTIIFSKYIAVFQGDINARLAYIGIAPSVFLVSLISCFRGYFQGFSNMKPTAISQVLEQVVKLVVGLGLCYALKNNVLLASASATLAVTVSELITLIYLIQKTKKSFNKREFVLAKTDISPIIKTVFPMTVATIIMPITRTVDSFLILNIVKSYSVNATEYYGLYSGAVESIVSLPVSFCYALAVTSIPIISKLIANGENHLKKIYQAVFYTLCLSALFSLITCVFSKTAINILYSGLSSAHKEIAVKMLRLSSLSVLFLPIMQTLVACVNATGNYKVTILGGVLGAIVKIILSIILLKNPSINVFGAIISDIFCYLVACFVNLSYIIYSSIKLKVQNERNNHYRVRG